MKCVVCNTKMEFHMVAKKDFFTNVLNVACLKNMIF